MSNPKPVWISEYAIAIIKEAASGAHPKETGGILLGVYVNDRPWVTNSVQIEAAETSHNFYRLPSGARPRVVDELRKIDSRLGYLGEWHSHPAHVGPSLKDKLSMASIGLQSRPACPNPLLIVAMRDETGYSLDIREWCGWRLTPLQAILAGNLPRQVTQPTRLILENR
jgi:hypothetical protein